MIQEQIPLLLPKAISSGLTDVEIRQFPLSIYCNKRNYFVSVSFDKIDFFPHWAHIRLDRVISGQIAETYTGDGGTLDVGIMIVSEQSETFMVSNESIDTDARLTLIFRGWQYGET